MFRNPATRSSLLLLLLCLNASPELFLVKPSSTEVVPSIQRTLILFRINGPKVEQRHVTAGIGKQLALGDNSRYGLSGDLHFRIADSSPNFHRVSGVVIHNLKTQEIVNSFQRLPYCCFDSYVPA